LYLGKLSPITRENMKETMELKWKMKVRLLRRLLKFTQQYLLYFSV
jgi:hypothetical protein